MSNKELIIECDSSGRVLRREFSNDKIHYKSTFQYQADEDTLQNTIRENLISEDNSCSPNSAYSEHIIIWTDKQGFKRKRVYINGILINEEIRHADGRLHYEFHHDPQPCESDQVYINYFYTSDDKLAKKTILYSQIGKLLTITYRKDGQIKSYVENAGETNNSDSKTTIRYTQRGQVKKIRTRASDPSMRQKLEFKYAKNGFPLRVKGFLIPKFQQKEFGNNNQCYPIDVSYKYNSSGELTAVKRKYDTRVNSSMTTDFSNDFYPIRRITDSLLKFAQTDLFTYLTTTRYEGSLCITEVRKPNQKPLPLNQKFKLTPDNTIPDYEICNDTTFNRTVYEINYDAGEIIRDTFIYNTSGKLISQISVCRSANGKYKWQRVQEYTYNELGKCIQTSIKTDTSAIFQHSITRRRWHSSGQIELIDSISFNGDHVYDSLVFSAEGEIQFRYQLNVQTHTKLKQELISKYVSGRIVEMELLENDTSVFLHRYIYTPSGLPLKHVEITLGGKENVIDTWEYQYRN
ncbi:MAG: hypothetical protein ACK5Z2_00740 [Bacteroidota bacterium]